MNITLSGIAIELGEQEHHYQEADQFEARVEKYRMTNMPDYWGWGYFRSSQRTSYQLAQSAIRRSLEQSGLEAERIDLVIYCSAGPREAYQVVNEKMGSLLKELSISNAELFGQCFAGCVSIFSAIKVANVLLRSGQYRNVLIVTTDKIAGEAVRFREFGIYSDSASCFLLSSEIQEGFDLLSVAVGSDFKLMSGEMEDKDSHFRHLQKVHQQLFEQQALEARDFEKIFITNLYKPLLQINMVRLGYKQTQSYYSNIERYGHCFSSDPLVNLQSYEEQRMQEELPSYVIGAMATGHAGFCALKKREPQGELIL